MSAVKYQSEERKFPFNLMIKIVFMWTDYQAVVKQSSLKVSRAYITNFGQKNKIQILW
jgi:hypothetical protein